MVASSSEVLPAPGEDISQRQHAVLVEVHAVVRGDPVVLVEDRRDDSMVSVLPAAGAAASGARCAAGPRSNHSHGT